MKEETYKCVKTQYNDAMSANMCYADGELIFLFDRFNFVKVGDIVTVIKDEKENTVGVVVNGQRKDILDAAMAARFRQSKKYLSI